MSRQKQSKATRWLVTTVLVLIATGAVMGYCAALARDRRGVPWPSMSSPELLQLAGLLFVGGLGTWLSWSLLSQLRAAVGGGIGPDRLSSAVNRMANAVVMLDREGVIEWVNEGFTRLSGFTFSEVSARPLAWLAQRSVSGSKLSQKLRDGFGGLTSFCVELPCTHRRGHRIWILFDFTPVFDDKGKLAGFIAVGSDTTPRRRADEDLAVLNRRTAMLLKAVGEGICSLDLQGNITFINPAAMRLTGWEPADLIGKPVSTMLYQLRVDDLPGGPDDLFTAAAFLDGTVLIGDSDQFRRKDGTHFPVEYTSTPVKEGEELIGMVVIFRDATERRTTDLIRTRQTRQFAFRAEVAFALGSGYTLRSFLQHVAQIVVNQLEGAFARVWTLDGDEDMLVLQASAGLYTHLDGHHSRIPVGTLKVGMVARKQSPQASNDLSNDPHIGDRNWVQRERMVSFAGYPLMMENKLIGVMAMFSRQRLPPDALELLGSVADMVALGIIRKRAEEKVVEQAALLDAAQDAIAAIDLEGRCSFWNKCAERIYGQPAKAVLGKPIDHLICPNRAYFERARQQVLETGAWKDENLSVPHGDATLTMESHWSLVRDDQEQPKSVLIVNTDVTERKRIESQFLRTQRIESIGTLAGGIAHDLNNVLQPVLMSIDVFKKKLTDPQSERMLKMMEASAHRGAGMVKQLLTFARGVDGQRMLIQPKHLVREVSRIVNETFPKSITLRTKLPDGLWTIHGDPTQLHQILVNLTVNARDAMASGGTLTISAENLVVGEDDQVAISGVKPGKYVVLRVADTGSGIPREILDKIFEPFFTTKPVGKGTGLGLSTVLGIIRSHGGVVQVQTEIDRGTTFIVFLPALEATEAAPEAEPVQAPRGNGELLLAVDDEPAVLTMMRETLECSGYRVLTATDGTEAVALYTAHRNEVAGVVTDMLMPHMDGPATIRVLRRLNPDVRVIASSGLMDDERIRETTGVQGIPVLHKPFTSDRLLLAVHQVLHESAAGASQLQP